MIKLREIWECLVRRKVMLALVFGLSMIMGLVAGRLIVRENAANQQHNSLSMTSSIIEYQPSLSLQINGADGFVAYQMDFSEDFQKANLRVVTSRALAETTSVRIFDQSGQLVRVDETSSAQPFYFKNDCTNLQIGLSPGYVIEVNSSNAKFYSKLDRSAATDFNPNSRIERYVVMANGLRKRSWSAAEGTANLRKVLQRFLVSEIERYKAQISETNLTNRNIDIAIKAQMVANFEQLDESLKAPYREFIEKLKRGGVPSLTWKGKTQYAVNSKIRLEDLIWAYDNEDGRLGNNMIKIETNLNAQQAGRYFARFEARDSDSNVSVLQVPITIIDGSNATNGGRGELATAPNLDNGSESSNRFEDWENSGDGNTIDGSDSSSNSENYDDADGSRGQSLGAGRNMESEGAGNERTDTEIAREFGETAKDEVEKSTGEEINSDEAKKKSKLPSLILAILAGMLALLGLTRFIFDHYVR